MTDEATLLDQPEPNDDPVTHANLFSPGKIALGTFLGGPFAAVWLITLNLRRMNRLEESKKATTVGSILSLVYLGIVIFLPLNLPIPNIVYPFALALGVMYYVRQAHGAALDQHFNADGGQASGWAAVGIGLLCAFVTVIASLLLVIVFDDSPMFAN